MTGTCVHETTGNSARAWSVADRHIDQICAQPVSSLDDPLAVHNGGYSHASADQRLLRTVTRF